MLIMVLQLLVSGTAMGSVYTLTAVEYTLIWNSSGLLNFGHEKVIILDAYILAEIVMLNLGAGMVPGVIATLVLMALFGVVIAFTIFIPLRHMSRLCAIMAIVMVENVINEAARLYHGPEAITAKGFISSTFRLGGLVVAKVCLYIILVSVVIAAALELPTRKAKTGKAIRCIVPSKTAAALMDVNIQQNMAITIAISFAICGAPGMPVILVFSADSSMATMVSLKGFAVGMVGRFGSLPGAIVGGLALEVAENITGMVLLSTFKDVVTLVVLVIILLVKPPRFLRKKQ